MGHAELLHPENIGAKIYFGRHQSMAAAVSREKNDLEVSDSSLVKRIRRTAERCFELHQLDLVQALHLVEAAASDHSEYVLWHLSSGANPELASGRIVLFGVKLAACRRNIEPPAFRSDEHTSELQSL